MAEFIFAATEETIFVHVIISAKLVSWILNFLFCLYILIALTASSLYISLDTSACIIKCFETRSFWLTLGMSELFQTVILNLS